jgi:acyl-CoA dehydrogenase
MKYWDPHPEIRETIERVCSNFDAAYWQRCDEDGVPAYEFIDAMKKDGWLGIVMPSEYGGAGLGLSAAATMVQTIAESGGGWTAVVGLLGYIYGPHAIVRHGTPEQKARMLPPLASGELRPCFAVTEPQSGLDTTRLRTMARREGDTYYLTGEKVWITGAHIADRMLIIARTTPIEETKRPIDGLSLFYAKIDRDFMDIVPIKKHGLETMKSNQLFLRDLPVAVEDRIGEEGKGFRYLLDSINPERILGSAMIVGLGKLAVKRAAAYANERIVFNRPIGMNQSIQHPLAKSWMELEAANLMVFKAASLYEAGEPCGIEANSAKYLAAEAANAACRQAMMTHGGFGYAKDFHVERLMRESMLFMLVPVGQALAMSFVAEHALDLPKSY